MSQPTETPDSPCLAAPHTYHTHTNAGRTWPLHCSACGLYVPVPDGPPSEAPSPRPRVRPMRLWDRIKELNAAHRAIERSASMTDTSAGVTLTRQSRRVLRAWSILREHVRRDLVRLLDKVLELTSPPS